MKKSNQKRKWYPQETPAHSHLRETLSFQSVEKALVIQILRPTHDLKTYCFGFLTCVRNETSNIIIILIAIFNNTYNYYSSNCYYNYCSFHTFRWSDAENALKCCACCVDDLMLLNIFLFWVKDRYFGSPSRVYFHNSTHPSAATVSTNYSTITSARSPSLERGEEHMDNQKETIRHAHTHTHTHTHIHMAVCVCVCVYTFIVI